MSRKSLALLLFLIFIIGASLFSIEIREGGIKLVIHENSGRFSLYHLEDVKENVFVPLIFDEDPRTTTASILVDNKIYSLGDSFEFKQSIDTAVDSAEITWESSSIKVVKKFNFISSSKSTLADGISITLTIQNISESNKSVGIRYLLDSYLGEKSNIHFHTDSAKNIQYEREFMDDLPKYWLSPKSKDSNYGLQVMCRAMGTSPPNKIVFANWKRLNDSSWSYNVNTSRNYSRPPYSVNDSAVAMYYNPKTIGPGENRTITLSLGAFSEEGFVVGDQDESNKEISNIVENLTEDNIDDLQEALKSDLITVRDLINQIDLLLDTSEEISEEKLYLLNQIIKKLEERKKLYE